MQLGNPQTACAKATSYVNHYLWTFHFHHPPPIPPPTSPSPPRTVSTGVLFPSPTWTWPSRVPVSTTIVTPCWSSSEMKMTKQETSTLMQKTERFALKLLPVLLCLCRVKFNWILAELLSMVETCIYWYQRASLPLPSPLASSPSIFFPFYFFPLLFQFPIPTIEPHRLVLLHSPGKDQIATWNVSKLPPWRC